MVTDTHAPNTRKGYDMAHKKDQQIIRLINRHNELCEIAQEMIDVYTQHAVRCEAWMPNKNDNCTCGHDDFCERARKIIEANE